MADHAAFQSASILKSRISARKQEKTHDSRGARGGLSFGTNVNNIGKQLASLDAAGTAVRDNITKVAQRVEDSVTVSKTFKSTTLERSYGAARSLLDAATEAQQASDQLREAIAANDENAAVEAARACVRISARIALLSQAAAVTAHSACAAKAGYIAGDAVKIKTRETANFAPAEAFRKGREAELRSARKEFAMEKLKRFRELKESRAEAKAAAPSGGNNPVAGGGSSARDANNDDNEVFSNFTRGTGGASLIMNVTANIRSLFSQRHRVAK